jgi:Tol biopolymer transport system component
MKITQHMTSYVADLSASGTSLSGIRHFPESESSEGIADWTPDSRELIVQSNRASDYFGMYRQPLSEESAVPLDTKGFGRSPSVTPDGKWILYLGYGGTALVVKRTQVRNDERTKGGVMNKKLVVSSIVIVLGALRWVSP